jgi:hypothetical protein
MMHKLRPRQGSLELDLNERPMPRGNGCVVHDDVDPAEGLDRVMISESAPAGVKALSWRLHSTSTAKALSFDTL